MYDYGVKMDFKSKIASLLSEEIKEISKDDIEKILEVPPDKNMGDLAFPCFKLSKIYRKSPMQIASDLAGKIQKPDFVSEIKQLSGYLNFFIDNNTIIKQTIHKVLKEQTDYMKGEPKGKTVIVEYSSPNIAKPFHIGHVRTTVIGNALYNIYKFAGYDVVGINHLGDYGTQFGKLIVAYKKWGDKEELKKAPIKTLLKLYVKFHEEAEKDPTLEDMARAEFKKLEDGDENAKRLWEVFREESLNEFSKVYKMLLIHFDSYAGESFYQDKMSAVIQQLKDKNLLMESQNAHVVDLEKFGLGVALIQKSDGSSLYLTRDIATAIYRMNTYNFYKCLYVVGSQQSLHFNQLKKIIELMGYTKEKGYGEIVHVQFGMVSLEEGTIATRKGRVVFLEDVLNNAIKKTRTIIEEKNPNLKNIDQLAKQIGVGAVVFQELSNSRTKDYMFSMDKTLSFEGETGPYVQYTHARACSVLRKSGKTDFSDASCESLAQNDDAVSIVKIIASYGEVIERTISRNEPHHIARYMLDLSQAFNRFYHSTPILTGDQKEKNDKLALTKAVALALESTLKLFNMSSPDEM